MRRKATTIYPNAVFEWPGCPMTCPESCPYPDCTMPAHLATRLEPKVCHGWVVDKDGSVVLERDRFKKGEEKS